MKSVEFREVRKAARGQSKIPFQLVAYSGRSLVGWKLWERRIYRNGNAFLLCILYASWISSKTDCIQEMVNTGN